MAGRSLTDSGDREVIWPRTARPARSRRRDPERRDPRRGRGRYAGPPVSVLPADPCERPGGGDRSLFGGTLAVSRKGRDSQGPGGSEHRRSPSRGPGARSSLLGLPEETRPVCWTGTARQQPNPSGPDKSSAPAGRPTRPGTAAGVCRPLPCSATSSGQPVSRSPLQLRSRALWGRTRQGPSELQGAGRAPSPRCEHVAGMLGPPEMPQGITAPGRPWNGKTLLSQFWGHESEM